MAWAASPWASPTMRSCSAAARTLYLSASGNILLGGSTAAGGHDILIGVKPVSGATNATWNATFWGAGLRVDSSAVSGYSRRALRARTGQIDVEQALQSARRRRLRLHRDQLLCVDRRWHAEPSTSPRSRSAPPARPSSAPPSARPIPRAYEIYFGVQTPALSRNRRLSEPAGSDQRRQFRTAGEPDLTRPVRDPVRHRTRQEQPDRNAALPAHPERRQRAHQ